MNDTYKTIAFPSDEILFKEKNSKFFGYAFPVTTEEEIKNHCLLVKDMQTGKQQNLNVSE